MHVDSSSLITIGDAEDLDIHKNFGWRYWPITRNNIYVKPHVGIHFLNGLKVWLQTLFCWLPRYWCSLYEENITCLRVSMWIRETIHAHVYFDVVSLSNIIRQLSPMPVRLRSSTYMATLINHVWLHVIKMPNLLKPQFIGSVCRTDCYRSFYQGVPTQQR